MSQFPTSPILGLLLAAISISTLDGAERVDFDRDIRPILSEKCFQCHGPDGKARQAELRLDTREGLFADRGDFRLIVGGKLAQSELFARITAEGDERMPPAKSGLKLSRQQQEAIRRWIEQGAVWTGHWAFQPPRREAPPLEGLKGWPRNAIDYFVLARLRREKLSPSREATRKSLIRRVTLDLTGLPPTPVEVAAFVADRSSNAYEKVVDRLLKSPRYGERMAWEWLDAARYADTDGFQGDPTRTMWPWRDWLVKALNDNLPFDRFTIEMLAGDLFDAPTPEQVIATGFNRNHMHNGEGGRIAEETRVENVFDRAETTSTLWLGLTMTCARCHDHKYDPLKQKEYYQFFAFFNNTSENGGRGGGRAPPVTKYLVPAQRARRTKLEGDIAKLKRQLDAPMPKVDRAQAAWEIATALLVRSKRPAGKLTVSDWSVLGPFPAPGGNGARAFAHDYGPEKRVDLTRKYAGGKLAWRVDSKLVDGKVHPLGNAVGATYLYRTIDAPSPRVLDVSLGSDDGIKVWLNGKQMLAKNVARAAAADQEKLRLKLRAGKNELLLKIVNTGGISGFYFRKTAESVAGLPPELAAVLAVEPAKRNDAQRRTLRTHYRKNHSKQWNMLNGELTKALQQRGQIDKSAVTVMVMDDLPKNKARKTSILFRGTYNKPQEKVTAGTPAFLPALPKKAPRNRLTLARWLVDPSNPLTARVTVNRYWQTFFGAGLVKTSEDFGRQGDRPSHPKLLDWLATRFVDSGWNVKAIHKLIVMSATYRQQSRWTKKLLARDPDNRLLARSSRYRLPSWMLRDQALALGGLLVEKIGGPPVKPYQPAGIWAEATFGKIRYKADQGDKLYRRSLYVFWRRIVGPTMFFDSAKRQTCEVKPTRTNTPLHALTTLNDTTFVEAARAMAQRTMQQPGLSSSKRIAWAFRLATSREPQAEELAVLVRRFRQLKSEFVDKPFEAKKILAVGKSPRDKKLEVSEHAAYAVLCGLLLNLDEVLTRE